jgi:hypothetical protein
MRRQPVGAGIMRDPPETHYIRHARPTQIAQQRDLVEG